MFRRLLFCNKKKKKIPSSDFKSNISSKSVSELYFTPWPVTSPNTTSEEMRVRDDIH